jgi:hypothetical protein
MWEYRAAHHWRRSIKFLEHLLLESRASIYIASLHDLEYRQIFLMTGHAVRVAGVSTELSLWDPASSIPTLIGSLLSVLATLAVIFLWIFAGGKRRQDFRYALILNLAVAGMSIPILKLTAMLQF